MSKIRSRRDILGLGGLALILSLHFWFPRLGAGASQDTYSVEVGGHNAFFQLCERQAPGTSRNLEPWSSGLARWDIESTVCILGPARYPRADEWTALLNWVHQGGRAVVAARWDDPDPTLPDLDLKVVATARKSKKTDTERAASEDLRSKLAPVKEVHWESRGTIEGSHFETLVESREGVQAARIDHGAGELVLIASDNVFSNESLYLHPDGNGVLAFRLVESLGSDRPLIFDEYLNRSSQPRAVGVLLHPQLRPLTVQSFALLFLFGWFESRRFGGLLPRAVIPRRDIAAHTDALGNLYYKAHGGREALQHYAEQLRSELHWKDFRHVPAMTAQTLARRLHVEVPTLQAQLLETQALLTQPRISRRQAARGIQFLAHLRRASRPQTESGKEFNHG